jgi:hypothetical protein
MKPSFPVCIAAVVCLIAVSCTGAYGSGETGAQFLRIGVGARACAMGDAYSGVSDDATAVYWNPGGLSQITSREITFMHNSWLMDMSYQYMAFAAPSRYGTFGVALAYSSSGDIPKYEDFQKNGEYSASDLSGAVAYGNNVGSGFSYGLGIKFLQMKIEDESATGIAADIGLLYQPQVVQGLKIGAVARHLGPNVKFIKESDPLPRTLTIGAALARSHVTLAADVSMPRDEDVRFGAGAEALISGIVALRAGYNSANSYTVGAGIIWRKIEIGYAFVPYEDIDDSHRISATLSF